MKTPAAQVTGRSPGEEHLMVMAGRHLSPRSGTAVKRLAAGTRRLVPDALRRDPQDRWAAVFGRIAGYSFAVAVVSGVPLLPLFRPSMATLVYHGSYRLLDGVTMSQAYQSVLAISFDVRGGLLIRQVHHWSADLFVAAIINRAIRRLGVRGWFALMAQEFGDHPDAAAMRMGWARQLAAWLQASVPGGHDAVTGRAAA